MPITINPPIDNLFLGPGHVVEATSSNQTPLPGAYWELAILTATTELFLAGASNRASPQSSTKFWVNVDVPATGPGIAAWPEVTPRAASPVQAAVATVRLRDATGLVIEQTSTPVQWAPEPTGVAYVQSLAASTVTGGFTATDRQVLESTNASVLLDLPLTAALGGIAHIGLDALDRQPPIDFLSEGENLLLSGRGSITRPSGATGVYAYGGRWSLETAPAGLGKLDGAATRYYQRIAQFVVIKNRLGGGEYSFIIQDSHYESEEMSWPIPFPVRIDFDILPGVVVRWRWLLLLQ